MAQKKKLPFESWQIQELRSIALDFYARPENEAAFQEWKAAKDKKRKGPPVLEHRRALQGDGF